ncbi:DUF433 domain-containing protein [Luteolibacter sp. GHJ8]|uniref:DUF433 domain-containing protein n=1 Tax=Luteolibacter rhizosphaerae TaxID=2989719 RepID=A0ABT3GA65_9BACT|nr:DUF433 domain-containing protein [Luteolibacter rhizosphaerae]MCW1916364.1 DUF433 domain-containing protein [Luteolibacter rhizosphaerae]
MPTRSPIADPWQRGIYTIPDASLILKLPADRLRRWVTGREHEESRHFPAGNLESRGQGKDRHLSFLTLIELFTIDRLRKQGLTMLTLRKVRDELSQRFHTEFPFALEGLMISGKMVLKELGDAALLELGTNGQTAFNKLVTPFCERLDFSPATKFASRYFPLGKEKPIVVDPKHAFGKPTIVGTNITTEAICSMLRSGDSSEDIAEAFQVSLEHVSVARAFEMKRAA